MTNIKKLHLRDLHILNSAKLTEFAGWEMPVSYGSAVEEHLHTRNESSLFDVSHMGEIRVKGRDAGIFLDFILTNSVKNVNSGRAIYSPFCNEDGGTVDDLIAYKKSDVDYLLCVNASNIEKDYSHFIHHSSNFDCEIINESNLFGQLALQGPGSEKILASVIKQDLSSISKMSFIEQEFSIGHALISRTGYSGEDGFEIYCPLTDLESWAISLSQCGNSGNCRWAGLAARDSLRLEAGFPLYGHELSSSITPVQAGLSWAIKWEKKDFLGRQKLLFELESGTSGRVKFYEVEDRRIPRDGTRILFDGKEYGEVLSGGYSPSLKKPIGSALISSRGLDYIQKSGWKAEVRTCNVDLFFAPPVIRHK
ncbi:MAG: glycine cleavage system aminomethyltransferase GcvT [Opitutales bacterium]|nr:glycine cleavage system aminomethyltransferase GcvT [Opitutales bacterium]MDG1325825.1 glycine cleavage system aminomethyltransferase GcvT [Opitutales bacterium]